MPPQLTDNGEIDEGNNQTDIIDNDSDYEDEEDTIIIQGSMSPLLQPSGMNITLPIPIINTMEQFDTLQV
eukprot:11667900-Ditylum_brightwellii.AAC.1